MEAVIERLVAAGIEVIPMPGLERHFVFARGNYASLVEKSESGFGNIGAAGLVTESGMAMLVWRAGVPYFVAKQREERATEEQVAELRRFSSDLERALKSQ